MIHNIRAKSGHELNIDAAQREIDRRSAEGEDMSWAQINQRTYEIVAKHAARPIGNPAPGLLIAGAH